MGCCCSTVVTTRRLERIDGASRQVRERSRCLLVLDALRAHSELAFGCEELGSQHGLGCDQRLAEAHRVSNDLGAEADGSASALKQVAYGIPVAMMPQSQPAGKLA